MTSTIESRVGTPWLEQGSFKFWLRWILAAHALLWVAWLTHAFTASNPPVERDWYALREVGRLFLAGDFPALYAERSFTEGQIHLFRYPPFVLYPLAILAMVPPLAAYAMVCISQLGAAALSIVGLYRLAPGKDADLVVAGVFGSAALAHVIVIGQNSAVLALMIVAAALAWNANRPLLGAGVVACLLWKPNWLPIFALLALRRGGVRAGLVLVLVGGVLVLSTLPLGPGVWRDFYVVTSRTAELETLYLPFKEITLMTGLRSVLGLSRLTNAIWAAAAAVAGWCLYRAWQPDRLTGRQVAAATLCALAFNPYGGFYDGLVLMIPATIWCTQRETYPDVAWRLIAFLIAAYWLWDLAVFYYVPVLALAYPGLKEPSISMAGFIIAAWFVVEALATRQSQ